MKRIKTGINGLDELIEGGFPEGRSILLTGGCGTGKTIFGMQYIYKGAQDYNDPGIYVSFDERPELLRQDMLRFGWDIRKLETQNMIQIIDGTIAKIGFPSEEQFSLPTTGFDIDKLLLEILRSNRQIGAKRIVIDSIPAIGLNYDNEKDIRNAILKLSYLLAKMGLTSILITETTQENKYSKYEIEEFVVDGVIVMHYLGIGTRTNRTMHIRKMRSTKHSENIHPIEITNEKGIIVKKTQTEYDEI
ncbi:MAG: ATPase domain-containing protein [Candidatus Diapherotrites archaeon]